jgi:hypothetical protein
MSLEIQEILLDAVSMDKDMFLDNKAKAVKQEEKITSNFKKESIE